MRPKPIIQDRKDLANERNQIVQDPTGVVDLRKEIRFNPVQSSPSVKTQPLKSDTIVPEFTQFTRYANRVNVLCLLQNNLFFLTGKTLLRT